MSSVCAVDGARLDHPLASLVRSASSCRLASSLTKARHGGARRDRTDDLMLAKHALSQLSYGPVVYRAPDHRRASFARWDRLL